MKRQGLLLLLLLYALIYSGCVAHASTNKNLFDEMHATPQSRSVATPTAAMHGMEEISEDDKPKTGATLLPFPAGEQLIYEVEFSKALLRGINIADFRFTAHGTLHSATTAADAPSNIKSHASPVGKQTNGTASSVPIAQMPAQPGKPDLRFTCEAKSKGFFNRLFGLNFLFAVESFVASETFSIKRSNKIDEQGKRRRTSEAVFDLKSKRVVWSERDPNAPDKRPRIVESSLTNDHTQDVISILYYLRTLPLAPDTSFDLFISDSGRVYRVPARVVGRKRLDTILGKVEAVQLDADIFGKDQLVDDKGTMSVWFTDDARHIPLRARVTSNFGTVTVTLKVMMNAER